MKPIFMKVTEGHYINLCLVTEIIDTEEVGTVVYFGGDSSEFNDVTIDEIMGMVEQTIKGEPT
jgi:hypothetical protein